MRLVVADDSLLVREGLTRLLSDLGHEVVAVAERAEAVPALVASLEPDVLLVDIKMPPTYRDEGLRCAVQVRRRHPTIGVLVLSQYVVAAYATLLLEQSPTSTGYLLKDRILDAGVLDDALSRIAAGQTVVDPHLVDALVSARRRAASSPLAQLSQRELDVLTLVAQGQSDRGIAAALHVSPNTVGTHLKHIFSKLDLPDSAGDNRRVHAVLAWLDSS